MTAKIQPVGKITLEQEPGWKRIEIACKLIDFALEVKELQIRTAHPEFSAKEVRRLAIAEIASN